MSAHFAGYVRVSRQGDREELRSPDFQREAIRTLAQREGFDVEYMAPEIDVSGSKASRPILDEVVRRIEAGEIAGLAVWRLDRLSRLPPRERAELFDRIESAGGQVKSASEDLDASTPQGRFVRDLWLGIARMQWEMYRDGFEVAKASAIARGVHVAPYIAPGYKRVGPPRKTGGPPSGPLVLDPDVAPLIRELFERRAAGAGPMALRAFLRDRGVQTSRAGTDWPNAAIYRLLANRVYLGEARSGELVNPTAHEPIVDPILFAAANRSKTTDLPPMQNGGNLLTGLCRCASCGYAARPTTATRRGKSRARIYACEPVKGIGTCTAPATATADTVEAYVVEQFFATLDDVRAEGYPADDGADVASLEDELSRATRALELYRDDPDLEGTMQDMGGREQWRAGLRVRNERVRCATDALADATARQNASRALPTSEELRSVWPDLSIAERRAFLADVFDCVVIRQGRHAVASKVALYLKGTAPRELPRRGVTGLPLAPLWPSSLPA